MQNSLLIVGTVAYDSIKTPYGDKEKILGGSGTHASVSASLLGPVHLVSVIGEDFAQEHLQMLQKRKIDTKGIQVIKGGKTFSWTGYYENDMNQAHSLKTDLNVLADFDPNLPEDYKNAKYVFLGNIDPNLQLKVLAQLKAPKVVALDSMNFWITSAREKLLETIQKIDILLINDAELRQLMGMVNILQAARQLIRGKCQTIIVKKGEHGSMVVTAKEVFAVPGYPLELVKDPTGAGDSFAGGVMSWLASTDDISQENLRKAIVYGSTIASFNVEEFSCERLQKLSKAEINHRLADYQKVCSFAKIAV